MPTAEALRVSLIVDMVFTSIDEGTNCCFLFFFFVEYWLVTVVFQVPVLFEGGAIGDL